MSDTLVSLDVLETAYAEIGSLVDWLDDLDAWLAAQTRSVVQVHVMRPHSRSKFMRNSIWAGSYNCQDALGMGEVRSKNSKAIPLPGDRLLFAFEDKREAVRFKLTHGGV